MALKYYSGNRITGTADDRGNLTTTNLLDFTNFHETDTDDVYTWDGDSWNIVASNTGTETLANKTFSSHITVAEVSAPGTPSSGFGALYAKNDNKLYFKNDAGTEYDITAGSAGGEANQDAWGTFVVSGQSNVVADSESDSVTLVAGSNMTITTNAGSDTITFASAAGGSDITVQDEGSALSTAATTLNFVGSAVTASGTGATKTITITGDGGSTITVSDNESTNENNLITFVADAGTATGAHALEMDGDFHYNPSTGRLTATQLAGTLQTAAQTNITSLGTLTALDLTSGDKTIFATVGSNTLTIGAGGTTVNIAGNLTVTGTTTTVSSNTLTIGDALYLLNSDETGTPTHDSGFVVERGSSANVALIWDESADEFAVINTSETGTTAGNVNISSYANLQVANLSVAQIGAFTATGAINFGSQAMTNINVDSGDMTGVTISGALTWSAAQNLNSQALTNINVDSGAIDGTTIGANSASTVVATQVDITAQGDIRLQDTTGGQYVGFQAPGTVSSSVLWTLPSADGSNTHVLQTNGSGVLSWVAPSGGGGTPGGSNYQVQYNNSSSFGGASNVEVRSNTLALKEQSAPSAVAGYGHLYPKTDNNLYYLNDAGAESQLTGLTATGNFYGTKAYLNADLNIATATATVLGDSNGSWTEIYDAGTWHDASTNPDRFTFPSLGYYLVTITQRWGTNSSGYRELKVRHTSGGSTSDILVDRISNVGFTTPYSTASTVVYISNTADYLTVSAYQTSGATVSLEGGTKEDTAITVSRLDSPSNLSSASMSKARLSTATTAIAHNTETAIGYNAEVIDTNTYHDNSTNNHRFTIPTTGYYLVKAKATLAGTSGDANYEVRLRIKDGNGVELAEEYTTQGTVASTYVTVSASSIAYLSASAWVAAYVTHQRDAATNLIGGDQELTSFEIVRLDGAIINTIDSMTDTNITSPADASLLIYDTATAKWIDNVISGDATMADTGAITIAANAVEGTMLNANTVDDSSIQLASNTLNVKAAGITGTMLNANVVDDSSLQLASNTLNVKALGVTNAMLAGSIANGKLANSSITVSDGSNTSAVALGGTVTFAATANETTVVESSGTVTIGLPNDVVIAGNLTVNGTTTTVSTTNMVVEDNLIELNNGAGSNANDSGIVIERGSTGDNAIFVWDESADKFIAGTTTATGASTGNLTITTGTLVANIEGNVTGALTGDASGTAATVTGGTQAAITAAANLVTVGTIGTGVWQGTAVTTAYGGTGLASYTAGDIVYYATGTTLTKLAKGTAGQALKMNSGATAPEWADAGGSADQVLVEVAQSSHGFAVGDILRSSGADDTYAKALATTAANAEVVGIVKTVTDSNNFIMVTNGHITTAAAVPNNTAGSVLFLSPSTAGALTTTEPTTDGQISKPVAIVTNANDSMLFLNLRGKTIGADAITTEKLQSTVTQNSHGFAVGDVIRSSGTNGQYQKAVASTAANAEAIGIVVTVADSNTFTGAWGGIVDTAAAVPNVAAGTVLFLSASSSGALTATEPSTAGQVSKPFAVVTNQSTEMILTHFRGEVISSASATAPHDAQYVTLATNATLTVERVLTGGSGITLTDGGAGSTLTVVNDLMTGGSIGGHVLPSAQNTYDLGSTSYQWRNVYTQDFHLNNTLRDEGNSIDGTKGDWTIQEGEEDLFIVNNKTGKKFKFNLTEVS